MMCFRYSLRVKEFSINPDDGDTLVYSFSNPRPIVVALSRRKNSSEEAQCLVSGEWELNPKVQAMFESLLVNELPTGSTAPHEFQHDAPFGSPYRDVLGDRWRIREGHDFWGLLPQSLRSFAERTERTLRGQAVRTISVLRWRCDWHGPHNPVAGGYLEWSFDGNIWKGLRSCR